MRLRTRDTLLNRCLKGDRNAQNELYLREVKGVYHLIIRLVNNRMDAEDLTQECFVQVFRSLAQFRGEAALRTWIKRIAINLSLAHLRKARSLLLEPMEEHFAPEEEAFPLLDMEQVHAAIKALPEGCRVVLSLHLLEGYPQQEVAEIMKVSLGTVKSQYWRAKQLLRQALNPKTCDNG